MSDQEEDEFREDFELSKTAPAAFEDHPAHFWAVALSRLYLHGELTGVIELLRRHVPLSEHQSEFFANLLDPSKAEGQFWHVKLVKSVRARKSDTYWELFKVGNKVRDAEAAGEKKYLAVERIAKEIEKSERYVWKAVAFAENPMKILESED
jgi:hypothetical protein